MEDAVRRLQKFSLSETEAKVYLFVLKYGPIKGTEISSSLQLNPQMAYHVLESLSERGFVDVSLERPRRFTAVPPAAALGARLEEMRQASEELAKERERFIQDLKEVTVQPREELPVRFRIIQGREEGRKTAHRIIEGAQEEVAVISTENSLIDKSIFGTDAVLKECARRGVRIRILANITPRSGEVARDFLSFCEVRHSAAGAIAHALVIDRKQVMLFATAEDDVARDNRKDVNLWTNNAQFAGLFAGLFESAWSASEASSERLAEIEGGREGSVFEPLDDPRVALRRMEEVAASAKFEVLAMMNDADRPRKLAATLEKLASSGVKVRVMGPPPPGGRLAFASPTFERRVVDSGQTNILISDSSKMMRWYGKAGEGGNPSYPERAFYTDATRYVSFMKETLERIWEDAKPLDLVRKNSSRPEQ